MSVQQVGCDKLLSSLTNTLSSKDTVVLLCGCLMTAKLPCGCRTSCNRILCNTATLFLRAIAAVLLGHAELSPAQLLEEVLAEQRNNVSRALVQQLAPRNALASANFGHAQ